MGGIDEVSSFYQGYFHHRNVGHEKGWQSKRLGCSSDHKKKRVIWLARFVITAFLYIFRKWRHDGRIKNRFCLNHFISEEALIMEEQNEFTAKEISFCIPLFGKAYYQKFQQLNEHWIRQIKPNYQKDSADSLFLLRHFSLTDKIKIFVEDFFSLGSFAERINAFIKKKMIDKIHNNPLTYLAGADIRYSDHRLVFLPVPQRQKIINNMLSRLTKIKL